MRVIERCLKQRPWQTILFCQSRQRITAMSKCLPVQLKCLLHQLGPTPDSQVHPEGDGVKEKPEHLFAAFRLRTTIDDHAGSNVRCAGKDRKGLEMCGEQE